jgi:hypothetical protein
MTQPKLRYLNVLMLHRLHRARRGWLALRDRDFRTSWRSRWHPRHRFTAHRRAVRR